MNYNKEIKKLQRQIEAIKIKQHNCGMEGVLKSFIRKQRETPTRAEAAFWEIAKKKKLNLIFQYPVRVYDSKGSIKKFYIADFCDVDNKIIFEVDGEYHEEFAQRKKDFKRTKDLNKLGYKVYRITNDEVFAGKTTQLLYDVYKYKYKHAFAKI